MDWPAVGGEDGRVEVGPGVGEPGGALVVEVGEGALREVGGVDAGRVEPAVAELDEAAGGLPYSLALLGRWVRERECLEAGRGRVREAGDGLAALGSGRISGPELVEPGVEDAEHEVVLGREGDEPAVRKCSDWKPSEDAVR